MARTVREVMNHELFSLRPSERAEDALAYLAALGISGAPVIEGGKPVGVISFHDLIGDREGELVRDRMTSPALTIEADALVEAAARIAAEHGVHRVVVVDDVGRAIGVASSLDLLRGLLGVPVSHPATFPHLDLTTGLCWTDDAPLDVAHIEQAPRGPGLLVLVRGAAGVPERVVWAEPADDVRDRALTVLTQPQASPTLRRLLTRPHELRFRVALTANTRDRRRALRKLLADAFHDERAQP